MSLASLPFRGDPLDELDLLYRFVRVWPNQVSWSRSGRSAAERRREKAGGRQNTAGPAAAVLPREFLAPRTPVSAPSAGQRILCDVAWRARSTLAGEEEGEVFGIGVGLECPLQHLVDRWRLFLGIAAAVAHREVLS